MEKKLFSLPALGTLWHSERTKEILAPHVKRRNQSAFVRQAILDFADNEGFDYVPFDTARPDYVSDNTWDLFQILKQKGYGKVDYTYIVAFHFLKSLPQYQFYNKSKLIREIIENSN